MDAISFVCGHLMLTGVVLLLCAWGLHDERKWKRSFYDDQGRLVKAKVTVCGRLLTIRFPTEPDRPDRNPFLTEDGRIKIGEEVEAHDSINGTEADGS